MRISLKQAAENQALVTLAAELPPSSQAVCLSYQTRLGALLRVEGESAGAYDREHHDVFLPPSGEPRLLTLEVERRALPTNGLPSGPGLIWSYLLWASRQKPSMTLRERAARYAGDAAHGDTDGHRSRIKLLGHSHLDVAWLWTYEETKRKAQRTFAIACDLLDHDAEFRFIQSQPQLYAFVQQVDEGLFKRVRTHVQSGRFDARVAALWVESDCNIPSGESLLRQMLYAYAYCKRELGVTPEIAWLPDSFGFMNTIPQLLAHAGIAYFATTKLQWNDTTKFPYPQFVWQGPDGSSVIGALLQGYDGPAYPWRVKNAQKRHEPIAVGYGDGGGGVTQAMLDYAHKHGEWIDIVAWFAELKQQREALPVHRDELYLEYHRGVYTTHHDVKFHNALCERALAQAEELLAWCVAVHASRTMIDEHVRRIDQAWHIVLRQQFHDVLPGTSVSAVYDDVRHEYAQAESLIAGVINAAQTMLPRALTAAAPTRVAPNEDGDAYLFDNGLVRARVREDGSIVELAAAGGRNLCTQANVLAMYGDKPKAWEAWNVDRGYDKRTRAAKPSGARVEGDALIVDLLLGKSPASMTIEAIAGEPFLRVTLNVDWHERRTLLRVENWLAVQTDTATYGAPHGVITRSARSDTPQRQAKFEVPGQRFACVGDAAGDGVALLALDTYGWNARALPKGGVRLGHSLLRGTCWPDETADIGEQVLAYAFMPLQGARNGDIERAWERFAHDPRVRLFTCDDAAVAVAACKPAMDGDGVIVRVRECNGAPASVRLRCGARMTWAAAVDGLERATFGSVAIQEESLLFELKASEIRSFRVRFSHA